MTYQEFVTILEAYNLALWPLHGVAYVLGLAAIWLVFRPTAHSSKLVAGILAIFWLWVGVVFNVAFWGRPAFGALFVIQAVLFVDAGLLRPKLSFGWTRGFYGVAGLVILLYALVGYPLFGYAIGHRWPQSFPFGLVPCPTCAFTMGLLLLTTSRVPKYVLAIPLLWSLMGVVPISWGILEEIGMLVVGVFATAAIVYRDRERFEPEMGVPEAA
jgi:hypothetical protein